MCCVNIWPILWHHFFFFFLAFYQRIFKVLLKPQKQAIVDVTHSSIKRKSKGGKTFQMSTVNSAQLRSVATRALCTCPAKSIMNLLYRASHSQRILGSLSIKCVAALHCSAALCRASPELSECDIYVRCCLGIPVAKVWELHWSIDAGSGLTFIFLDTSYTIDSIPTEKKFDFF